MRQEFTFFSNGKGILLMSLLDWLRVGRELNQELRYRKLFLTNGVFNDIEFQKRRISTAMSLIFPIKNPISILMYHQVAPYRDAPVHPGCYCDVKAFEKQMAMLHSGGYSVISVKEAAECVFNNKPKPKNAVVLTFDDGCDNFREYAFPIIKKYGFPVTVYIITQLLGHSTREWIPEVEPRFDSTLMTAETLRALRKEGVDFGAHTRHHVHLSQLDSGTMREEIFGSKKELEDILGESVGNFCYPFGDLDDRAVAMVEEAGFQTATTCVKAAANYAKSPLLLPRKRVDFGETMFDFWWKLNHKNKDPERRRKH
jgi:peptidoglycan/xylan/chitin deacetylase (PgdA/CDA1 family)